jgi:hypothetical protein
LCRLWAAADWYPAAEIKREVRRNRREIAALMKQAALSAHDLKLLETKIR